MIAAEAGLAVIVLAVTVVLVTSRPARTAQIEAAAQQASAQQATARQAAARQAAALQTAGQRPQAAQIGFDGGAPGERGVVDLVVFPATVGANEIHLSVLDPVGALMTVPEVTATLSLPDRALGPLPVHLQQLAPGHYSGAMTIPMAGRWQLAVAVRTSEVDQDTVRTPLDVR